MTPEQVQKYFANGHTIAFANDNASATMMSANSDLVALTGRHYTSVQFLVDALYIAAWLQGWPSNLGGTLPIPKAPNASLSASQAQAWAFLRWQGGGIVTGGPGTGKTWLVTQVVMAMPKDHSIVCCALAGKAVARLKEKLGSDYECKTIHSLLGYIEGSAPEYDEFHQLDYDMIVVDECTLLSDKIMAMLLRAVRPGTHMIFVGDPNQLPPVGAGQPFADMCYKVMPCCLTENQRFGSDIARYAYDVSCGVFEPGGNDSVFVIPHSVELTRVVNANFVKRVEAKFGSTDIIHLCCTNEEADEVKTRARWGRTNADMVVGERVMFTRTNYDLGFFNGEMATIKDVDKDTDIISMALDRGPTVELQTSSFDTYCQYGVSITAHRSQGSEWDVVVLHMTKRWKNRFMMDKNLFYTAITRAKKGVVIYGDVKGLTSNTRNSLLQWLDDDYVAVLNERINSGKIDVRNFI